MARVTHHARSERLDGFLSEELWRASSSRLASSASQWHSIWMLTGTASLRARQAIDNHLLSHVQRSVFVRAHRARMEPPFDIVNTKGGDGV